MTTTPPSRRIRGHVLTYGEGRVCAETDCPTWLSRYNSTPYCAAHQDPVREPNVGGLYMT